MLVTSLTPEGILQLSIVQQQESLRSTKFLPSTWLVKPENRMRKESGQAVTHHLTCFRTGGADFLLGYH